MTTTWQIENIQTLEDFDRFLTDNGFTIVHDWNNKNWKDLPDEWLDDVLAEEVINKYAKGENDEWNIAGLPANEIGMQLIRYIYKTYRKA